MIPDYLTFIRIQDKRNLIFIYIATLILLGFYWKNAEFSFSERDIGFVSVIFALVLYNVIFDLKAYWAYKCVIKNVDFSYFKNKNNHKSEILLTQPFVAGGLALLLFSCIVQGLYILTPSVYVLIYLATLVPLIIFMFFRIIRHSYIKQMAISVVQNVKYKTLWRYVLLTACITTVINVLTISPLRYSEAFSLDGQFLTIESMIAFCILCAVVLTVNLIFMRFTKRYIFLGRLFLKEIDLSFSTTVPLPSFCVKPLWWRLFILLIIELLWILLVALITTLIGTNIWFEVYFLICYIPCFIYCFMHVWWQWHNDFMMSCDMYLRWGELCKQTVLW
jgi:hypothetical protein